jgi:osmotically-inducible protein OsmY
MDRTMFGANANSDKALQRLVDRRMQRSGGGGSGLRAVVMNGSVTLSGNLKYESQRIPLLKALRGVSGVRNVLDQLRAPPKLNPHTAGNGSA